MEASFGLHLVIYPAYVENRFWQSDVYRRWAQRLDVWEVGFSVCSHIIIWQVHGKLPADIANRLVAASVLCWLVECFQLVWSWCRPESYFRWRIVVKFVNRGIRLIGFFKVVEAFRRIVGTSEFEKLLALAMESPICDLHTVVRNLLWFSGVATPLVHAVNVPLPFLPQLFFHSLYLLILFRLHLQPSMTMLQQTIGPQMWQDACVTINEVGRIISAGTLSGPQDDHFLSEICSRYAVRVLTIHMQLLGGFFIPVYLSYRLERFAKDVFIFEEIHNGNHNQEAAIRPLPFPHLVDVLVLTMSSFVAWILVMNTHVAVVGIALPA